MPLAASHFPNPLRVLLRAPRPLLARSLPPSPQIPGFLRHQARTGGGFFARGFKADIGTPSVGQFGDAVLSFANFTDAWNDATGNPVHTCASNKIYCPDVKSLSDFKTMSIWAEGVEGDVQLEVNSITGYNCKQ